MTLLTAAFITFMSTTVTGNMIPNFTAFLIKQVPNKIYFFSAMTAYTLGSLAAFWAFNFTMLLVVVWFQQ